MSKMPPEAPGAGKAAGKLPRWARVTLIVSLAGNLMLAGLIGGAVLREPHYQHRGLNLPIEGFRSIAAAMPGAERETLRRAVRAHGKEIRSARREMRTKTSEFFQALRADPFSEAQLASVLEDQARIWAGFGTSARALLVHQIAGMSDSDRALFADNLERELAKRRKPGRDGPPKP